MEILNLKRTESLVELIKKNPTEIMTVHKNDAFQTVTHPVTA